MGTGAAAEHRGRVGIAGAVVFVVVSLILIAVLPSEPATRGATRAGSVVPPAGTGVGR